MGLVLINVTVLIQTSLELWKRNFESVLKWAEVFLSIYFLTIFSPRTSPAPYPADISFVLICRSLRMYEEIFDKGFLGNFCSFVRTGAIFPRSRLVVSSDYMQNYFIASFTPRSSFCISVESSPCPQARCSSCAKFWFLCVFSELPTYNLLISPCHCGCSFKGLFYPFFVYCVWYLVSWCRWHFSFT
jgi:hypothetical protein